ncbi:MAG: hypothetical protein DLM50_01110 [Candidatus Meridianibacter frigidus]|nr:MAG: hypothetical protein DLM50_01110 [Candidatus Eremiobacteraeota bacterium]
MIDHPQTSPCAGYEEACVRAAAMQRLDDASILPLAHTTLLEHGAKAPLAVVLLHGFTNHPGQYRQFAPMLHQRGANVFIPRLPEQGDRDRMTRRMKSITAEQLVATAWEAIDIAQGLGERVAVCGISTSGLLCAYLAQYRSDVARSVPVNPVFGLLHLPLFVSRTIEGALLLLPNRFMWWDPRRKTHELPTTGYPRFPTRGLAQAMRIGDDVRAAAGRKQMAARTAVMVTNLHDPAVNNTLAQAVAQAWRERKPEAVEEYRFRSLPVNHDIIDPENSQPRLDIVYPKLLELIEATP